MSQRYALHIAEQNFALIRALNRGGLVKIEEKTTYFLFDVTTASQIENREIKAEDDLYDEKGHLKEDVIVLM